MNTRITELLGVKYPIFLSGMSWISTPKMVAEVSNAGGIGILATGPFSAKQTKNAIREIRNLTDKPFGANCTLHYTGAIENAKAIIEEEVPVVNFALGKGDWLVERAHKYGGKVIATVVNARHGKRAQDYGCDAVIATSYEAAAHGEAVAGMVLIPHLVEELDVPVIAAGGIADGRGFAAALALGAEGVAMGTRFMTTRESPLHDNFKKLSLEKNVTDTVHTPNIDGIYCRVLDSQATRKAMKKGFRPFKALVNSYLVAQDMELSYPKLVFEMMGKGLKPMLKLGHMAQAYEAFQKATEEGNMDIGILPAGQVTGLLHDEPSVSELMARIVEEAKAIHKKMGVVLS